MPIAVGAHVRTDSPLEAAEALGAEAVQVFLSNPQGWEKPPDRPDAAELAASPVQLYVHAPYLINVCSPRNNVRFGSRKILQQTCDAASAVGAEAVIVHGGHAEDGIEAGVGRWARSLERLKTDVRVLIENTAGGTNAVARTFEALARLWDDVGSSGVGFCFDTCHAHAAGEDLSDAVERVLKIVGRIDVVHVNDSKDPFGSGRDRHTKLGTGQIGTDALRDMLRATKADVFITETPGTMQELSEDIAFIREACSV